MSKCVESHANKQCKSLTSKADWCGMSAGNFFKCVWKWKLEGKLAAQSTDA